MEGFPPIASGAIHVGPSGQYAGGGADRSSEDGSYAEGDLLIGADGLHSMVRDIAGAKRAKRPAGAAGKGLITIPHIADKDAPLQIIGVTETWPVAGGRLRSAVWFDLPWSPGSVRPEHPIDMISPVRGLVDLVDEYSRR